jgi:hypothetical protein
MLRNAVLGDWVVLSKNAQEKLHSGRKNVKVGNDPRKGEVFFSVVVPLVKS